MKPAWSPRSVALLLAASLLPVRGTFAKDEPNLEEVQVLKADYLHSVTSVTISNDGKFLYAAAYNSSAVSVFKRDAATGLLESISWMDLPELKAAVGLQLSPGDEFLAAASFRARAVSLFKRDAISGEITFLDAAIEGEKDAAGLGFVVDTAFSPDHKFLYTASSGGIGVFQIDHEKLVFAQVEAGDGQMRGLRSVTISPNGKTLYAAATQTGKLGVFRRDEASGKIELLQMLANGADEIETLNGVMHIACSADEKHVYVSSGRFNGDQAITVFAAQPDGKLQRIEAHVNGDGALTGFQGGNTIVISPDGKLVYAVASVSDQLVRFERDPATGRLTFLGHQVVGPFKEPGSAGVCFSPDGKFVYVADEFSDSIVVLKQP